MKKISDRQEDYLRAIYILSKKYKRAVKALELTVYLDLKKSTVTERVQDLVRHKLVKHQRYSSIELTKKGLETARKLTFKHRTIEVFLHDFLKLKKDQIHEEAHKLEHAFSDEAINKLYKKLGNPKKDPHGQTISII